ncbi:MAG: hypothetical protein ABII25_01965 [bacterium]
MYSFEIEGFTKKTWEWKGEFSVTGMAKIFNRDEETQSQEFNLQLVIDSRWDWNWSRLYLIGDVWTTCSNISGSDEQDAFLREGYWQFSGFDHHTFEMGKRLLRWGKGYAFNPVALLERPKNQEDPEASREGLWIMQGVWIPEAFSGFSSYSVTLVYLPIRKDINEDYQADINQKNTLGLKLYGLIGTTDIDLYFVRWNEIEETDLGADFAANITSNFEMHGEYAVEMTSKDDYYKYLLGFRYLTEKDVTWIIEGYHNSSKLTKATNRNFGYLKTSIKEPFNWLYFTPSLAWLRNLDDESQNVITQLNYAPAANWIFQISWQHFSGKQNTQYGENLVQDKLEIEGTYYF